MTQLMLFDAPASVSVATPVANTPSPAAQAAAAGENERWGSRRQSARASGTRPRQPRPQASEEGGMHHMGDLARLVLMRYEMVHRRRTALAQRQARCAG